MDHVRRTGPVDLIQRRNTAELAEIDLRGDYRGQGPGLEMRNARTNKTRRVDFKVCGDCGSIAFFVDANSKDVACVICCGCGLEFRRKDRAAKTARATRRRR